MMKKILTVTLALIITITIGLLNWYSVPTMSDDVMYNFVWQKDWSQPLQRIQTFADVVRSQIQHYQYISGRSVTVMTLQTLQNLIPFDFAKIINALLFLLLTVLTAWYVMKKKAYLIIVSVIVFALFFLVVSGFGSAFIWLTGSMTYTLALLLTISFLLLLRKTADSKPTIMTIPLSLLAVIMGCSHEAIAIPLAVAMSAYLLINRKGALSRQSTYLIAGYTMGALIIILSPSLWNRADLGGITPSQRLLYGCINMVMNVRVSWLLLITLLVVWFRRRDSFREIISRHLFLLTAWIMALAIVVLCGTTIERVAICADYLAMLVMLPIWQTNFLLRRQQTIMVLVAIATLSIAVPSVRYSQVNAQNYRYHRQQLMQEGTELVKVRQLPSDKDVITEGIIRRYVFPTIEFGFYNCYMAFDSSDSNSKAVAALYHQESTVCLPEDVIERIEKDSTAYTQFETDLHGTLYIKRIADSLQVSHVVFELGPEVPLKPWQKLVSYDGNEYELDEFNYETVSVGHHNYLVMTTPTTNIKRRIRKIRIE